MDEESLYAPLLQTLTHLPADTEPMNRMLYLECKHFLADHNLNYNDKMGMAAGVEVRVPLLDLELMELAGSLPINMKQRGTVGKWIFKRAMEPYLPHDVIYRPKTGFGVPLRKWLQGVLKPLVDDLLSPRSLLARGVFEPIVVRQLLDADRGGKVDASYTIFGMVCLELWFRQYIDGAFALDSDL
jgi:asparagine synthase (glutamine-hydrolysing)